MPRDVGPWTTMLTSHPDNNMINLLATSWDFTVVRLAICVDHVEALFNKPNATIWCLSDHLFPLWKEVLIICRKGLEHGMHTASLRCFRKKLWDYDSNTDHLDNTSYCVRRIKEEFCHGLVLPPYRNKTTIRFVEMRPETKVYIRAVEIWHRTG